MAIDATQDNRLLNIFNRSNRSNRASRGAFKGSRISYHKGINSLFGDPSFKEMDQGVESLGVNFASNRYSALISAKEGESKDGSGYKRNTKMDDTHSELQPQTEEAMSGRIFDNVGKPNPPYQPAHTPIQTPQHVSNEQLYVLMQSIQEEIVHVRGEVSNMRQDRAIQTGTLEGIRVFNMTITSKSQVLVNNLMNVSGEWRT